MKNWIKQNKINILLMIIYSVCSFIILVFHESWRDEAQSWLIVRDLNFVGIIKQMRYEGHFLLWYIILMPFAKLGFPYVTVKIISWVIMNITVWLILKKAPFKWWVKTLIIFSFPMLYLYPIISRCYCIIPLAITLIAITYDSRKNKPIQYVLSIILLANTHVIMLGLVGMLLLTFYIEQIRNRKKNTAQENKKIIISFFIVSILLIISILPLLGSLETNKSLRLEFTITRERIVGVLRQIFFCIIEMFQIENENLISLILFIIIIVAVFELKNNFKNFIIIFVSILYQFIIYEYIYGVSMQRASTILIILLLFAWIQKTKKTKIVSVFMIILLIINCLSGITDILEDVKYDYSSAKCTAEFIKENMNENSIFISNHMPCASAIIAYMDDFKVWNPKKEDFFTYVTWDEDNEESLNVDLMEKIRNNFSKNDQLYYIFAQNANSIEQEQIKKLEENGNLIKIFESEHSITKEDYSIYEVFF